MEGKPLIRVSYRSAIGQRLGYVIMVALPWVFTSPEGQIWGLIWTTLVMSVAGTVLAIGFNAMFAEVLPPEWRAHAVGRRNILLAISITVATILSGQILDRVEFPGNYQIVFLIGTIGAMLSSYHIGRLRKSETIAQVDRLEEVESSKAKLSIKRASLVRLDLIKGPFGLFMLAYLAFYAFQYFPVPLIERYEKLNASRPNDFQRVFFEKEQPKIHDVRGVRVLKGAQCRPFGLRDAPGAGS